MSYPKPEDVSGDTWEYEATLYDGGEHDWSAATGKRGGEDAFAIRWNGNGKNQGFPQSRGYPVWFFVPPEMEGPLRQLIDDLPKP